MRWFCPEHVSQARPGDMDPPPPPWRYSESGAIVETESADQARDEAAAESRRRQHEAALAERAAEAEALEAVKRGRDEAARAELPPHLRELIA